MDWTRTPAVVRCVHQGGFLADDARGWKWPGRGPGSTYRECCWVDTLAVRWAPTIRWLPLRFREEREACYVLNIPPAESWCQGLWSTIANPTTLAHDARLKEGLRVIVCVSPCKWNCGMRSVLIWKCASFTSYDRLSALQWSADWVCQICRVIPAAWPSIIWRKCICKEFGSTDEPPSCTVSFQLITILFLLKGLGKCLTPRKIVLLC